jgi:effector-binding domain-containing protein
MSNLDALEFVEVEVPPTVATQMPGQCGPDPAAIAGAIGAAFGELMCLVQQHKLAPSGPPRTIYTSYGARGIEFIVATPIAAPPAKPIKSSPGFIGTLPASRAMRFAHRGPYTKMKTYGRITELLKAKGLMKTEADWAEYMPMWEECLNDPQTTPEANLLTYIYLPVV